jgi:DNA-binding transcriptional ArsR family regulator
VKKTSLHPRTVRYALKKLKERELLIEKLKMNDLRQILYQILLTGIQKSPMAKPDIFCNFQEHNAEMTGKVKI